MRNRKRGAGFTLVEIMIVVAIIGLLAAIVIPNLVKSRQQSRASACVNNLRLLSAAKDQAAIELGLNETVVPTTAQISPYLKNTKLVGGLPVEPGGGSYTVGAVSTDPTCSLGGTHTL